MTARKTKDWEKWVKTLAAIFCVLYAIFAWISQPKSNAEKILQMEQSVVGLENMTRQQDRDIARLGGKIEALDGSISEMKSDIRDIRNVVLGKKQ